MGGVSRCFVFLFGFFVVEYVTSANIFFLSFLLFRFLWCYLNFVFLCISPSASQYFFFPFFYFIFFAITSVLVLFFVHHTSICFFQSSAFYSKILSFVCLLLQSPFFVFYLKNTPFICLLQSLPIHDFYFKNFPLMVIFHSSFFEISFIFHVFFYCILSSVTSHLFLYFSRHIFILLTSITSHLIPFFNHFPHFVASLQSSSISILVPITPSITQTSLHPSPPPPLTAIFLSLPITSLTLTPT